MSSTCSSRAVSWHSENRREDLMARNQDLIRNSREGSFLFGHCNAFNLNELPKHSCRIASTALNYKIKRHFLLGTFD